MKLTKMVLFTVVLLLMSGCQSPRQVTETEMFTQSVQADIPATTQPPTLEPSDTATPPPTETPTQTPTETPTEEPVQVDIDIVATYTAVAVDYESRLETMMTSVLECEPAPRESGWQDYRIDQVGLSMSVPADWTMPYDYRDAVPDPVVPGQRKPIMFRVEQLGQASIGAGGGYAEGVSLQIWREQEDDLIRFITELRKWEAERLSQGNIILPVPYINSIANGHPAAISYSPEYDTGERGGRWATIIVATKIGDHVIIMNFEARSGYDPTETLLTMLSSLRIDGVEGGVTDISETVLCQAQLYTCLKQCPVYELTIPDLSGINP